MVALARTGGSSDSFHTEVIKAVQEQHVKLKTAKTLPKTIVLEIATALDVCPHCSLLLARGLTSKQNILHKVRAALPPQAPPLKLMIRISSREARRPDQPVANIGENVKDGLPTYQFHFAHLLPPSSEVKVGANAGAGVVAGGFSDLCADAHIEGGDVHRESPFDSVSFEVEVTAAGAGDLH